MKKHYRVPLNSKRIFQCDGDFAVEYIDGEVFVIPMTNNFIDRGFEKTFEEKLRERIGNELQEKLRGRNSCEVLYVEAKYIVLNILMEMKYTGEIRKDRLPVVDVRGDLLLKKLKKKMDEAANSNHMIDFLGSVEKINLLETERSDKNRMTVYLLDDNHDIVVDWDYYTRGF